MLRSITSQFEGSYVKTLHDPIQTHALYGVSNEDVYRAKLELSKVGAVRFRLVKTSYGLTIVCFKLK